MRFLLTAISAFVLAAVTLSLPPRAGALTFKYLDPGYRSSTFATLDVSINALDIDEQGNLYVVDNTYWGTGTVFIDRYEAADGYSRAAIYTSYTPTGNHANGVAFDGLGNMYTSECTGSRDSGVFHKIDDMLATSVYHRVWYICPTGIDADSSGNIYFTGRKAGDFLFGNIYMLDTSKELKVIVPDFVGTAVAVDSFGNIFASNWQDNSLYMFEAETYTPFLIASFDIAPDGVAVDGQGNVYLFENTGYGDPLPTPIIKLTPVKALKRAGGAPSLESASNHDGPAVSDVR
ncbi:MAG: hypothetical protein ACE5GY_01620 [Thermodesulfobacteriota bacterium]